MAKGFSLAAYPWSYQAKYADSGWREKYIEKPHKTPEEEEQLPPEDLEILLQSRNSFPELPLINYTTQYGLGCFEGMKAFPQKEGKLKLFRPDQNAARFHRSMSGLKMPPLPEKSFLEAVKEVLRRNRDSGFTLSYQKEWEKDAYRSGHSVYLRPFTYSEAAIGLGLSSYPWVIIAATPVGSYFRPGNTKAITTRKVRAFPGGTGWIKCNSNYVIPILAKKEAEAAGYMEAVFLDPYEHKWIEEGSSCNIFFYLKNGSLVTPELGDTILPGITRSSVITLAKDEGITVEERRIAIQEAMSEAVEVFVTGTAAGISYIESITHNDATSRFNDGQMGSLTQKLLIRLKGIQYGAEPDKFDWMYSL